LETFLVSRRRLLLVVDDKYLLIYAKYTETNKLPSVDSRVARPHQQSARAHSARDQAAHAPWCIPRRAVGAQSCRGPAAAHCRYQLVDQTLFEYRAAEGPADERSHHRLSQCQAPFSHNQCGKNSGHYPRSLRRRAHAVLSPRWSRHDESPAELVLAKGESACT
jgi:hypothetical protein